MKIGEIIISSDVRNLDRKFHYYVPDGLVPGVRVQVPFGYGNNKRIGFFMGYVSDTDFEGELKEITKVLDSDPYLTQNAIKIANFVSKAYLCSFARALKLMLPPAIKTKVEKRVSLQETRDDIKLTEQQKLILDTLRAAGGECEIGKLKTSCMLKSAAGITALEKKGLVRASEHVVGDMGPKTKNEIYLNIDIEAARDLIVKLRDKAPAAARALVCLCEFGRLGVSELRQQADCSKSAIDTLVKYGAAAVEIVETYRLEVTKNHEQTGHFDPTPQQTQALAQLIHALDSKEYHNFLLHGVTGSGKTEVFLQAAQHCIKQGKNVIILVPEISLTPQMIDRFASRFGGQVALLHSGLSLGERFDEWCKIKRGEVSVVVGARSAIFAPFENVGLIVVDEEHEQSYKSESTPRYDATAVAQYIARLHRCTLVKASATPQITSYYEATQNRATLIEMDSRFNDQQMPDIQIIDMAKELAGGNKSVFSRQLQQAIYDTVQQGQQCILFLNRRGYSTFVSCRSCGFVAKCPNCSVSLTYHQKDGCLHCHYCDYRQKNYTVCPECNSPYIKYFGTGTQRLEEELYRLFPGISVLRMDADTTTHKFSHERILRQFGQENINVLLGTQMISKGLDFKNVTLVGVVAADGVLNMDDFRAGERAFAQLTQVCGRAGRGDIKGRALIQTYNPEDEILKYVKAYDYTGFYQKEIAFRRMMDNPPFTNLIHIVISGEQEEKTAQHAGIIGGWLDAEIAKHPGVASAVYGPCAAPISRIKRRCRYRILIKTPDIKTMLGMMQKITALHVQSGNKCFLDIDVNPNSVL